MKKYKLLMFAFIVCMVWSINLIPNISSYIQGIQKDGTYHVIRVVDGDTIEIDYDGRKEKVRLIGVNTPESVHPDQERNTEFGKIASDFTKAQLEGKWVRLEFDVQERDQYNRLLAYVWLGDKMYNETLLKEGYAQVATYPPNVKYVNRFRAAQEEAREARLGLWGE